MWCPFSLLLFYEKRVWGDWGREAWDHFWSYRSFVHVLNVILIICVRIGRTLVGLVLCLFSLCCKMEGLEESKDPHLPGENIAKEPWNPQVPLQDILEPSGTCPQPVIIAMTEPSPSVQVGSPSPMPGPMSTMPSGPQLLQSSVKDSLAPPPS